MQFNVSQPGSSSSRKERAMALPREVIIESAQAQQGGSASVAANAAAGAASAARA
jgi:hypothetical protein